MTHHVVVVDDAATNAEMLAAIVEGIPDTVAHRFTSSQNALQYASETQVDAFVLDLHMAPPDGREMVALLRADPRYALVPIVIVTEDHERADRLDTLVLGANDDIERPVDPRELRARLGTLLALQAARTTLWRNVVSLEDSLRAEERRSRTQANRMIALWQLISNPSLSTNDMLYAILVEGARAIKSEPHYQGTLARIEGDEMVIEANSRMQEPRGLGARTGTPVPLHGALQELIVRRDETCAWDDIAADPTVATLLRVGLVGMRSAIGTPFRAGRSQYVLLLWSHDPAGEPFGADEATYVELLARFFAARLEQAWQSERITHQLSHDSLTGLRNRTQFRVESRSAYVAHGCGALAVIDIVGFRSLNATYGHIIGDALLVEVGAALEGRTQRGDVVARLAGDTFGIFMPGIADEPTAVARTAAYTEAFAHPFSTGDREGKEFIPLRAVTGVAIGTHASVPAFDTLFAHADIALFGAKRAGTTDLALYQRGMESEETVRERFCAEIARAVACDELVLFFQPHLELAADRVCGAEALIRWRHPTRGLLMPDAFIPFAEETGMIGSITRWVMDASLAAAARLRALDPTFSVYFNLSAADLDDASLLQRLRDAAERSGAPETIGVELTETAAMRDLGATARAVASLQEHGISVALDDFGTGYSSLSLLKRLAVDVVKIDQSFIRNVLDDPGDASIAAAVIRFGDSFGFRTLAEGVESEDQIAWLRAQACHGAQGYAIARPLPEDEFVAWFQRRSSMAVSAPALSSAVTSPRSSPR